MEALHLSRVRHIPIAQQVPYTVTLTATNAAGSNTLTRTGYIKVNTTTVAPVASFTGTPTSGVAPLLVTFTDTSTNAPTSWAWNFGDGSTSSVKSPSHTYSTAGTYTVTLTATNAAGSNTLTRTGYVKVNTTPVAPVASFTGTPTSGVAPLLVTFTDTSTNSPTSWAWNFGDGSTSSVKSPSHTYTQQVTYTVTLTATNAAGSNTLTRTGYVKVNTTPVAPVASFTGTPTSGVAPLLVTFTDTSTNAPTSWVWNFGDGSSSTVQNPTHTYTTVGFYTVTLTVRNAQGSNQVIKKNFIRVQGNKVSKVGLK